MNRSQTAATATDCRHTSTISRQVLGGGAVYRKQYLRGDWGRTAEVVRERTRREFRLVEQLAASGSFGNRLGIVRIIEARPQDATLVMAEVPGVALDQCLAGRLRTHRREGLRALFLAGRWLRGLQGLALSEADRLSLTDLDPPDLVDYCRLRLEKLAELGRRGDGAGLAGPILDGVARLVEQSDEADRRLVWAHGDYAASNMIWDGRALTPIDFAMAHANRPLLDVTYLVHRLELLPVYRPWKRWPVDAWRRAVLRGYGRPRAEDAPMYRALMIRHLLNRLLTYARRPPRDFKQGLHDAWVRGVVRRRIARLV